jgi:hypothetical protein
MSLQSLLQLVSADDIVTSGFKPQNNDPHTHDFQNERPSGNTASLSIIQGVFELDASASLNLSFREPHAHRKGHDAVTVLSPLAQLDSDHHHIPRDDVLTGAMTPQEEPQEEHATGVHEMMAFDDDDDDDNDMSAMLPHFGGDDEVDGDDGALLVFKRSRSTDMMGLIEETTPTSPHAGASTSCVALRLDYDGPGGSLQLDATLFAPLSSLNASALPFDDLESDSECDPLLVTMPPLGEGESGAALKAVSSSPFLRAPCVDDDFAASPIVGRGASAFVRKMQHAVTGEVVAVKHIGQHQQDAMDNELRVAELRLRPGLATRKDGQFLVHVHGAFATPMGGASIVMDLMEGSLGSLPPAPTQALAVAAKMMLRGLRFIHEDLHMTHRDLKPSNLLYDRKGVVKITDFGLTCRMEEGSTAHEFVGSMLYMPPERLRGEAYGFPSDVFAFGVTMAHLALGEHPLTAALGSAMTGPSEGRFWGLCGAMCINDGPETSAAATEAAFAKALAAGNCSSTFSKMVLKCVAANAADRPTCDELIRSDVFVASADYSDQGEVLRWVNLPKKKVC